MKRFVSPLALALVFSLAFFQPANAQLGGLVKRAKDKVKNKVEQKIDQKIDHAVDKAINGAEKGVNDAVNGTADDDQDSKVETTAKVQKKEAAYAKSDFVPGDEIIFEDDLYGEQLGEFPSKWDLIEGNSEVVKYDGKMAISFESSPTFIAPLMNNPKNYLTSEFTIEYDFFAGDNSDISSNRYSRSQYFLHFYDARGSLRRHREGLLGIYIYKRQPGAFRI